MNPTLKPINNFFESLEKKGWIKRTPGILRNYETAYPYFKELEANHEVIRKECEALLGIKDHLHNMDGLTGKDTKGGIHSVQWKTFMFKTEGFIEENCQRCPETAALLKKIPRIKQAFFSILYPGQHIKAHTGYYYGFLRYHLGVMIPDNNRDEKCWLRVNDDIEANEKRDKSTIDDCAKYFWKNGEGVIFNDNYLHDAANESDQIRVVLFIDVMRKLPKWIDWFNVLLLSVGYRTKAVKEIATRAVVKTPPVD